MIPIIINHKILGIGCLIHYGYRFWLKYNYGNMNLNNNYLYPLLHLSLPLSLPSLPSLPSLISKIHEYRYNFNIIFTSRSVCMIYHTFLFANTNIHVYYLSRLSIILTHNYLADKVSDHYYKTNKVFHEIFDLITTTILLLSRNHEMGYWIMFPIQFSSILTTLINKEIIINNKLFLFLLTPYLLNLKAIYNDKTSINLFCILHMFLKFGMKFNKYCNLIFLSLLYIYKD